MPRPLAYEPRHALNAICPYYTMFPLEYPLRILDKYRKSTPVVLDPFCGRGTTIYAARQKGFASWGIDSSPIATAIAKSKLASVDITNVMTLAEGLIRKGPKEVPNTDFFRKAFHKQTLIELCSLRDNLLSLKTDTDASIILRAASLGCLHGPRNKTIGAESYFSNQMPRTFATKPDYSLKYWKDRNLKPPKVRVVDVLHRKLKLIGDLAPVHKGGPSQIVCSDSTKNETFKRIPRRFSVVITSPPYYGMRTYVQDQWLRMWFLGGAEELDYKIVGQLHHECPTAFIKSLAAVWKNIRTSQSDQLDLYVRFGALPSIKTEPKSILRSSLDEAEGWKIVSVRNALNANQGKRQAKQMQGHSEPIQEYDFHIVRA